MPNNDVIEAVDQYCRRLWKALHKLPSLESDDFVREVRSHILERIEAEPGVTPEILAGILQEVGEPRNLAVEYRTQAMLREVTREEARWVLRPWVLLRTTLRLGMTSITGLVAFLVTVIGYGCTIVFYLCALLKPFFPSRIGLWLAPQHTLSLGFWNGRLFATEIYGISVRAPFNFVLGTLSPTDGPVRELLGKWLIPVCFLCGAFFFLATSIVARWFIRRFKRKEKWSPPLSHSPSMVHSGRV